MLGFVGCQGTRGHTYTDRYKHTPQQTPTNAPRREADPVRLLVLVPPELPAPLVAPALAPEGARALAGPVAGGLGQQPPLAEGASPVMGRCKDGMSWAFVERAKSKTASETRALQRTPRTHRRKSLMGCATSDMGTALPPAVCIAAAAALEAASFFPLPPPLPAPPSSLLSCFVGW